MRRGFTLIEVLVVVLAIGLLLGAGLPAISAVREAQKRRACASLVHAVAAAMAAYGSETWALPTTDRAGRPATRVMPLWDWNRDQILDGDPAVDPAGDPGERTTLSASGYGGFIRLTGFQPPRNSLDPTTGRLRDPWGHPLRVSVRGGVVGGTPIGVWSIGRDGQDGGTGSPEAADNITSWATKP